ncbi:hypothetical protein ACWTQY_30955, partial [Klebsiella pneumoniae]
TFASFDPVGFEQADAGQFAAPQWALSGAPSHDLADATTLTADDGGDVAVSIDTGFDAAPLFDPVAAEREPGALPADDVVFRFDADALDNADDVLSLHAMET